MKKSLLIISITFNILFIIGVIIYTKAKRLPDTKSLRIESAYKISHGLLSGKIKHEQMKSENNWFLSNNDYLDSYAVSYEFESRDNYWKCAIGPMHPHYGPGIILTLMEN